MISRRAGALSVLPALLFGCAAPALVGAIAAPPEGPAPAPSLAAVVPAVLAEAPLPRAGEGATTAAPPDSPAPDATPADGKDADARPRIGAVDQLAYIYEHPSAAGLALGYIRMGTSAPLRSAEPASREGCGRGWYAVEPRGYVCLDPKTTLDLDDPYYRALASVAPAGDAVWYYRYAFSNGAPMYSRFPTAEEAEKEERSLGPAGSFVQLADWSHGHEELIAGEPIAATDPVPDFFAGGERHVGGGVRNTAKLVWRVVPNGSMVAYAKAFESGGRVWLLTPDLMLVPADRVRALRRSRFHGVHLGDGVELPLAWNRTRGPKPRYRRDAGGSFVEGGEAVAAKTFVAVAEGEVRSGPRTFLALRDEPGAFVDEADVTVSRARKKLPRGVLPGEKWIEAKILPGTLTAYEGDRPVYATLFSPGKGGVPLAGQDHTKYATTATGFFPLEWKDHVATMSNEKGEPKVLWFADVPDIQYLKPPLAMHVAYWHEDFGNPKSAECVNVSPEDGHFLFGWTDPPLPEGWGAVRPGGGNGKSTAVLVTGR
jgi:hypothetical protein